MTKKHETVDSPNAVSKFGAFIRLYSYPCSETAVIDLLNACERGDLGQVSALVAKGVDINARVLRFARKPLHIATERGHSHVVKFLLQQGADKDVRNFDDSSALILATQNGNVESVRALIDGGANVKYVNKFKDTALHIVCNTGRLQPIIERLADRGADVNQSDGRDLPLHIVSRRGYANSVEWLLQRGCDVDALNTTGRTPLHEACQRGQPSAVDILIKYGADCRARTQDSENTTPFLLACNNGNVKVVESLLRTGVVDLSAKNKKDESPLFMAYKSKNKELIRLLYDDYKAEIDGEFTALHIACYLEKNDCMGAFTEEDFKVKDYEGKTALHIASSKGNLAIVRQCIALNCDVNALDDNDNSPLYLALQDERNDVIEELINRDDVILDRRNKSEHTALDIVSGLGKSHGAIDLVEIILDSLLKTHPDGIPNEILFTAVTESCSAGRVDVLRTLLRNGAKIEPEAEMELILSAAESGHTEIIKVLSLNGLRINIKDDLDNTPIHKACYSSDEEFLHSLIEYDVDINAQNKAGKTVLHLATAHGQAHSVTVLLKLGARVDAVDDGGKTALHIACASGREQVFTVLLQHDACIHARDNQGAMPLHYASEGGNLSIIKTLLRNGADVLSRDASQRTCLHYACVKGYLYAACSLIEHGADLNAQDENGRTVLHVICERLFESPYVRRYVKFTDIPCDRTYVELMEILLQAGCDASIRDNEASLPISVILRRLSGLPESGSSSRVLFADEVSNSLFALLLDAFYPKSELTESVMAQLYARVGKPVMLLLMRAGCAIEINPHPALLYRLAKSHDMDSMVELHEAGYEFSEALIREAAAGIEDIEDFVEQSLQMSKSVLRLKELSRLHLRKIFRRRLGRMTSTVNSLSIPLQLKYYLSMG